MTRALGIELRRSVAPWLGVAVVAVTLVLTYGLSGPWTHGPVWDEQWPALGAWQRALLGFTWPVVVGLGALHGIRQRRSRMTDLLATVARPDWQRVAVPAAAVATALTAAVLVLTAIGAVPIVVRTGRIGPGWVAALLVGLLALIAGALAGMAVGHLAPSPVTPPVAAVLALAVVVLLDGQAAGLPVPVQLLSPVLPYPTTPFTTVAGAVHVGQTVVLTGLAVAALLALGLRRARWAAALPLGLAVAAGVAVLPTPLADAYPVDPDALVLTCDDVGPRVCVTQADADLLDELATIARPALGALAALPNAPTSVLEVPVLPPSAATASSTRLAAVPPDALPVDLKDLRQQLTGPAGNRTRLRLLAGAGTLTCDQYAYGTPDSAARFAVIGWLTGDPADSVATLPQGLAAAEPEIVAQVTGARDALLAVPRDEQVRRVAALRTAAMDCRDGLWDIVVGGAR